MEKKKFYLTTAIAYTSGKPHIGNTYEIVLSDAIARMKRMEGYDVFFCTGTDEHGQKIEEYAKSKGISPKEYVDQVSSQLRTIWDTMDTTYNYFIRTTDEYHEKTVQKMFKKFYEQGDIYKGEYSGWYCVPCESFFTESQLKDGCCPDCGRPVRQAKEEAYFFRMSKYQDRLMKHIEENPDFIVPESRKKEMINNFLKPGLQDLCVSRTSFKWGIPVDFDDRHVVYVWMDALTNYITALGYDPDGNSSENYKKYWPADVHIIGKDILRFHTIYWPIFLMALGEPLPKQIFGHPWLLFASDKMSKSKGNVIYADDLVRMFGVDAVRYYLLSAMPYGQDGNITYEAFIAKYNADLANTLGNLVNRTVAMVNKYFEGEVNAAIPEDSLDEDLKRTALDICSTVISAMDSYRAADALQAIINLAQRSNKYIDETMPWALAKDPEKQARLKTVLSNLLEAIRYLGVLLLPFMPSTSVAILEQINASDSDLTSLNVFGSCPARKVGAAKALFARLDEEETLKRIDTEIIQPQIAEAKQAESSEQPEGVAMISIDDFAKVELRAAKILSCEKLKKSKKLLKLQVDDGKGQRQVLSGISQWYAPEDLVGKTIVLVSNLKPAKLCGEESCGMILAADCPNGDVKVLFLDDAIPAGAKIR